MARKNKKRKSHPKPSQAVPTIDTARQAKPEKAKSSGGGQAVRETVESLVIAFVLAFLFRTYQAEAFVIPTGSMAPTLMGRHKDVYCSQCGQRYKVNASYEASSLEDLRRKYGNLRSADLRQLAQCVSGTCPVCRYPMPYDAELATAPWVPSDRTKRQPSFSGDRILVNKYLYEFTDPERWDVVVFKYPGDAKTNYIKRLVGLPEEQLMIRHGDIFVRPQGSAEPFSIARKSPSKILAMRQLVHDTDRDAARLYQSGWPLRWEGWAVDTDERGGRLLQTYRVEAGAGESWLRYRHLLPDARDWQTAVLDPDELLDRAEDAKPELITDYNAYNSEVTLGDAQKTRRLTLQAKDVGLHWVGDLMVEADVEIASDSGSLILELVEAGRRFTCTLDLATGDAVLGIRGPGAEEPVADFAPRAPTRVRGAGRHRLRFANFDDQLTLWVDDERIEFDGEGVYDAEAVFGERADVLPVGDAAAPGDLAPVGVAASGASVAVSRLQVFRDIYYIADSSQREARRARRGGSVVSDYIVGPSGVVESADGGAPIGEICREPSLWPLMRERQSERFETGPDQFFVLGDNSAASQDCRLWKDAPGQEGNPGGPYLERSLLIGKAVCVYWPHAWHYLPLKRRGAKIPIWPNFADMRLVR